MNIDDTKQAIFSTLLATMPTAAVASGFVSPVDHSLTVANVLRDHPPAKVAEWTGSDSRSIGNVTRYLVAHGLPCSDGFAKLYRAELMKQAMRDAADAEYAAKKYEEMSELLGTSLPDAEAKEFWNRNADLAPPEIVKKYGISPLAKISAEVDIIDHMEAIR